MDPRRRRLRQTATLALLVYWSLLFVSTHLPGSSLTTIRVGDKWLHLAAYAGLGFLLAAAYARWRPTVRKLTAVSAVLVLYAALDELLQIPVPNRQCDLADWFADLLGGTCGIGAYLLCVWLFGGRRAARAPDNANRTPVSALARRARGEPASRGGRAH